MLDMTVTFRNVTGKDEETIEKEDFQRLQRVSELGNDFLKYYNKNKIHFDKESGELIEEISKLFKDSHSTFAFFKQMDLPPSRLRHERTSTAIEKVRVEAPKLIKQLDEKLRDIINE